MGLTLCVATWLADWGGERARVAPAAPLLRSRA
jgi:hypothetical protein